MPWLEDYQKEKLSATRVISGQGENSGLRSMLKSVGEGPGSKQEDDKQVCSKFTRSHSLLLIVAVRAPASRLRNNLWAVWSVLVEIEHAHTTQVEFFQHFFTPSVECESLYPVRAGSGIIQVLSTKIVWIYLDVSWLGNVFLTVQYILGGIWLTRHNKCKIYLEVRIIETDQTVC